MEVSYTRIRLLCLGFAGASIALGHFFNGIHRPLTNATTMISVTVLNVILTYGLVLGKWGLPAMGVEGAAWGSAIATVVRALWLMAAMCFGSTARKFEALHTWRFDLDKTRLNRFGFCVENLVPPPSDYVHVLPLTVAPTDPQGQADDDDVGGGEDPGAMGTEFRPGAGHPPAACYHD